MNINTMLEEIDSATLDTEIAILESYVDMLVKCDTIMQNVNDYTNFDNIRLITESFIMEFDNKTGGDKPAAATGDTQNTENKDNTSQKSQTDNNATNIQSNNNSNSTNNTSDAKAASTGNNSETSKTTTKKNGVLQQLAAAIAKLFRKIVSAFKKPKDCTIDPKCAQVDKNVASAVAASIKGDTSSIDPATLDHATKVLNTLKGVGFITTLIAATGFIMIKSAGRNESGNNDSGELKPHPGAPPKSDTMSPSVQINPLTGNLLITSYFHRAGGRDPAENHLFNNATRSLSISVKEFYYALVADNICIRNEDYYRANQIEERIFGSLFNDVTVAVNLVNESLDKVNAQENAMSIDDWNRWYDNFVNVGLYGIFEMLLALSAALPCISATDSQTGIKYMDLANYLQDAFTNIPADLRFAHTSNIHRADEALSKRSNKSMNWGNIIAALKGEASHITISDDAGNTPGDNTWSADEGTRNLIHSIVTAGGSIAADARRGIRNSREASKNNKFKKPGGEFQTKIASLRDQVNGLKDRIKHITAYCAEASHIANETYRRFQDVEASREAVRRLGAANNGGQPAPAGGGQNGGNP